jgi:hypothetical protein
LKSKFNEEVEKSNLEDSGPDGTVQEFWQFHEVHFGFNPKTPFQPHDLICHHTNVQKC